MSVSLKIKIFESSGTRIVQVPKSTLTIGSASHCDIVLDHASLAPEHARAWIDGGRIWIQDLGSPNGTALNDIRLPALKPMLVRDLDVLRLGECASTLGLEAILVRAPVVKQRVADPVATEPSVPEPKGLSNAELQKRREEAETLAREVADLRLQLQMGNLEKASTDEMSQQLANLRGEIERVQEQKNRWDENLRQMEVDRQTMRKNIDQELLEFKAKALNDLKKVAGAESRAELTSLGEEVKKLSGQRQQLTENLNQAELEKDSIRLEMSKLAQNESLHKTQALTASSELKKLNDQKVKLTESLRKAELENKTLRKSLEKEKVDAQGFLRVRRQREARASGGQWRSVSVTSLILGVLLVGIWFGAAYFRTRGARSLSSSSHDRATVAEKLAKPERSPRKFDPPLAKKYRSSYTDNVLYLENYLAAEENYEFRKRWMMELNKVASSEWKVDTWSIAPIGVEEQALVRDLQRLKTSINPDNEQEGVQKMREREAKFMRDLDEVFKGRAGVERFLKFKRSFYQRNQAYLTRAT